MKRSLQSSIKCLGKTERFSIPDVERPRRRPRSTDSTPLVSLRFLQFAVVAVTTYVSSRTFLPRKQHKSATSRRFSVREFFKFSTDKQQIHNSLKSTLVKPPSKLEMPSNTAAWQLAPGVKIDIKSAPYTSPRENEIVVKNVAMAVNPADWILQDVALFPWMQYPTILGSDVAGEVAEVGSSVSRFKIGDRVLGHTTGAFSNETSGGGLQEYSVVLADLASKIPSTLSYASAAVLPLGLLTAARGLFLKDHLALELPSVPRRPWTGRTLLVWGGASSVGSNGIQLAVAAGYEVITTASPKNFDYVGKLGASQAFDYNSKDIVDQLVRAFEGKTLAGALHTVGSDEACFNVVDKISNGNKFVSTTLPVSENKPSGVNANRIFGSNLKDMYANEAIQAVFVDFLPTALAESQYFAAPEPWVIGKGLEYVQAGFDAQKKGVSAKKVVITL